MTAKDLIIDFINLIFIILLVVFCIVFFIAGNHFAQFIEIIKILVPLAIFGIIFLIKLKIARRQKKKRARENNFDVTLYLTYFDKLKFDIAIYLLPIIILLVALIIDKNITGTDIFQAIIAFLIMYLGQRILFKKEG